jgi:hypothetical protein
MSSKPSQPVHKIHSTSSPLEDNNTYPLTIPSATSQDPLYSLISHCDKDILEELTTHDFPWNALHHRALFLSQEVFHLPDRYPQAPVIFQITSQHSHQITNSVSANEVALWAQHPYIAPFSQLPHSVIGA